MQYPGRIGSGPAMTTAPITAAILRQPLPAADRPPNYLPATPSSVLWGRLPCAADAPVLEIAPGATVVVDTISHEGILEDQGRDPVAFFGSQGVPADQVLADAVTVSASVDHDPNDGPHVITGPIGVSGAVPGDVIVVHLQELTPRVPYGVISSRHGLGLLPERFPQEGDLTSVFCQVEGLELGLDQARGTLPLTPGDIDRPIRFALAPFLGIIGVSTPGVERLNSTPPGLHGGNLDIRRLVAGTSLYLPVQVEGGGLYVGDPHFAQGNGEVALTALEASLRATLRVDLVPAAEARARFGPVRGPFARTPEFLIPTGLDEDLDEAVRECGRNAVTMLTSIFGLAPEVAYAYLSAATDFEISQVVDVVKGAHALIRLADLAATGRVLP
ncbi:Acetamidase/Formamidase [Pseudonocardia dioxanivorans CB1190]|uniref:Acetamidase/Formamidase n=2 Tax=Pseudonocardia dioxanivorans TaxID=240495 RepID=F4CW98_PSEUX|nr:Acetamidase/Formamidase [Pseudonocardia dioxanivorans CB1190]